MHNLTIGNTTELHDSINQPSTTANIYSHGCPHLAQVKTSTLPDSAVFSPSACLLLERYREAVGHALLNSARCQVSVELNKRAVAASTAAAALLASQTTAASTGMILAFVLEGFFSSTIN